jgi:trk system potassium uptake protein
MKAIIIGAGDVGFHLASRLSGQGDEICVLDLEQEKVDRVEDHLDVMALQGTGVDYAMLERAGVDSADVLIAVTDNDEVNLQACRLAGLYGVRLKVARAGGGYYYRKSEIAPFTDTGADVLVNPERVCAAEIERLLNYAAATDVVEFAGGRVVLMGMRIGERCEFREMPLGRIAEKFAERNFLVAAISRGDQTIIPGGEDMIHQGDLLYAVGISGAADEIFRLAGQESRRMERVMIAGGGKVAVILARRLEEVSIVPIIFEPDRERCQQLADKLASALVLNGDATDIELLQSEGIEGVGAFVALTPDDENNIISSLVARNLGAAKTIAQIKRIEYMDLACRIGLDAAVSPHLSTVNAIIAAMNSERLLALANLRGLSVQIMEVAIRDDLPLVGRPLKDARLPAPCIVGAVVRGQEVFIPHGQDALQPGDRAIVFTLAVHAQKVSRFFLRQG